MRVCTSVHRSWSADAAPALEIAAGEVVALTAPDASHDQISERSVAADLATVDFGKANPVAGPVFVKDAHPGDVLEIEIVDVKTLPWGWTGIMPGFGLMADEFPDPWLRISSIEDGRVHFGDRVVLPARPFPGTIGVGRKGPGPHPFLPPSLLGGNIDIRHLTAGARLLLPVAVEGALLSIGDGHAAQGDGEVCGSAIETGMEITVRVRIRRDFTIGAPQVSVSAAAAAPLPPGGSYITTGVSDHLFEAAQGAVREMIDHLVSRRGLGREEAYALVSVAGDLKIHEIVNAPQWVVGVTMPDAIFLDEARLS